MVATGWRLQFEVTGTSVRQLGDEPMEHFRLAFPTTSKLMARSPGAVASYGHRRIPHAALAV
jgi:hypothetical protein